MSTIYKFNIPGLVQPLLTQWDNNTIVNLVQGELNKGEIVKSTSKRRVEWKERKDESGEKFEVIRLRTSATESLDCVPTIPARFNAWCLVTLDQHKLAETPIQLPAVFAEWFNKVAKKS